MSNKTPDATITIEIFVQPDGSAHSTSRQTGIESAQAGFILIDVGRDLLLRALAEHQQHHHHPEA